MTIAIEALLRELIARIDHQRESGNTENPEVFRALADAALILLKRGK